MFEFPEHPDLISALDLTPSVHGEADGGGLAGLLDKFLENVTRAAESGDSFQLFPGIQAIGLNVHPMLVHFPIALLSIFFVLDVLGLLSRNNRIRQTAGVVLYFGTIGAVVAAAAGWYAASSVPHGESVHEIMEWHERLGFAVTALAIVLSAWRIIAKFPISGMAQVLYFLLSTIMNVGMVFGADLGGFMVFQHGVAVRSLQAPDPHHHHLARDFPKNQENQSSR